MKNSTDLYIEEIHKIPLLTLEQEKELGYRIKNGDISAVNEMVEHNLRLVIPIAKLYQNRGIDFNDLIQYGNIGLITAAERYDVTKGTKFSTYAVPWIRQKIARAIEDYSRSIRLPNGMYQIVQKYNAKKQKLEKLKGYKLSLEELQEALSLTIDEIKDLERLSHDTLSLNMKIETDNYDGDDSLEDILCDDYLIEDEIIDKLRNEEILKFINKIIDNPTYIDILLDKYNSLTDKTYKSLSKKYNLSESDIRNILRKILRKLKSSKEILSLLDYAFNEKEVVEHLQSRNYYVKKKIK